MRNGQTGRRRGRSGGGGGGSGGGGIPGAQRRDMGNRLDTRQRGNAAQLLEKYRQLARDSSQAGDRVTAEYYLQYADHYYRVVAEFRERNPEQYQRQDAQQRRDYMDDDDGDDAPEPLRVSDMTVTHATPVVQQQPQEAPAQSDDRDDNEAEAERGDDDGERSEDAGPRRRRRSRSRPRRDDGEGSSGGGERETVDA